MRLESGTVDSEGQIRYIKTSTYLIFILLPVLK